MLPNSRGLAILLAAHLLAMLCGVAPAGAHATFAVTQTTPNSTYRAVLRIPHGCSGAATTAVRVTIPEGVVAVEPMQKPGWTLTVRSGPYAKTYENSGQKLSEGVKEILWSDGNLPDARRDEFVFTARLTADLPVGQMLYFPVIQECGPNAAERWVGIPAPGQSPHFLPNTAPGVMIVAAGGAGPAPMTAAQPTYRLGSLVISMPWIRATPKGAPVAGGYLKITNNGSEPDRLVGGSLAEASKFEVHEMSMDGGVMKMRPLANGLEIKAGETVELRPGGYHIMFVGLKEELRPGETVKGSLEFAKAGRVDISYQVQAMGAAAPAMDMHHQ